MDEFRPCIAFLENFVNKYEYNRLPFEILTLDDALKKSCFEDLDKRKMLALYLHNDDDEFSKGFCPLLIDEDVTSLLKKSCLLLAWDIGDSQYHAVIKNMLKNIEEFDVIETRINQKKAALLLIASISNAIALYGILQGQVKKKDIVDRMSLYCRSFEEEVKCEKSLTPGKDDNVKMNSKYFQQMMFDMLGDRDYDAFETNEHEYLKEKIGFAFFGPPKSVDGYDDKQKQKITAAYTQIKTIYEPHVEYEGRIVISVIYNCIEPLPKEKQKRVKQANKKKQQYDPETDTTPFPIFVLRKCILAEEADSAPPCRIFIDHDLRVYTTWEGYIQENKLPACTMILPRDGRYKGDDSGDVLLECHLAPSCHISKDILQGLDITSTVLGIGSGALFAAALIPTITVAPIALIGAGVVGAGVGVYSLVRSAISLADRNQHCEDMSFLNSEARGSYINIVAGSLGFVGAGATTLVSQLVSQGVNVGIAAKSTITALNVINLGASGAGILHSSYEVYIQWREENVAPSMLTVVQLSSSILFFGHAVYNFRTGAAIVEETQTRVLQEYQDGLRSNRLRKMFNKLKLETIRQNDGNTATAHAEVIATIRRIPNVDEVFAVLKNSNKIFNKNNVKFAASAGKITLNGVPVDISKFGELSKSQKSAFVLELPPTPSPSAAQVSLSSRLISTVFKIDYISICDQLLTIPQWTFSSILNLFDSPIQLMLLICLKKLLENVTFDLPKIFNEILPSRDVLSTVLQLVVDFFKLKTAPYEREYSTRLDCARASPGFDEVDFAARSNASTDASRRALMFFERAVQSAFRGNDVEEAVLRELIDFFMKWLTEKLYYFQQDKEAVVNRRWRRVSQQCAVCGGQTFLLA